MVAIMCGVAARWWPAPYKGYHDPPWPGPAGFAPPSYYTETVTVEAPNWPAALLEETRSMPAEGEFVGE